MATSRPKPIFVYLQRPDTAEWVTVGRYRHADDQGAGYFLYAPSYLDAGHTWSIDPVNLPLRADHEWQAVRYRGLHDALRDATPDDWGRALIRREQGIPDGTPDWRYLEKSGNAERWGALAFGSSRQPSVAHVDSPRLPQLDAVIAELQSIARNDAPINAALRRKLIRTPSLGGARPKASIRDGDDFWLVKPSLHTDSSNIPALEHFAHRWANAAGLRFARTEYHALGEGQGAVRVLRFDRRGHCRFMALSAATLLQTEYPGALNPSQWSYPRLAEELRRIGAPTEDRIELFGRMVFNALCGNDDDHPRNHAVIYNTEERRWRLADAFDVVPNDAPQIPPALTMQLSAGQTRISRQAVLADAVRFGFANMQEAETYLDNLLSRLEHAYNQLVTPLQANMRDLLTRRLEANLALLAPKHSR